MKILAIMGSPRKGETYKALQIFEEKLTKMGDISFEYVFLKDMNIKTCRGCFLCLEKGEEFCPHREDDLNIIVSKMMEADGVIMASPNYALQVTAIMKNLLDRMAYVFHRPRFFHKVWMPFITQGVYGGENIVKYLDEVGSFWGFINCRGLNLTITPGQKLPAEEQKLERQIEEGAVRLYQKLTGERSPVPSFKQLMIFNMTRSFHAHGHLRKRDHEYFKERGWFHSDYMYETKLGPVKRIFGSFFNFIAIKNAKKLKKEWCEYLSVTNTSVK